jgi:hypothetical protein
MTPKRWGSFVTPTYELSRVLLTLNRQDFKRLHHLLPHHAGIVSCTYDADFTGQAKRIHHALKDVATLDGRLIRINRPASANLAP